MVRTSLVASMVLAIGCSSDEFDCGEAGGVCKLETEVCLIGDGCSECVPAPEECASCGCMPPATDASFGDRRCLDTGACEDVDGGAVVRCQEPMDWGCG